MRRQGVVDRLGDAVLLGQRALQPLVQLALGVARGGVALGAVAVSGRVFRSAETSDETLGKNSGFLFALICLLN